VFCTAGSNRQIIVFRILLAFGCEWNAVSHSPPVIKISHQASFFSIVDFPPFPQASKKQRVGYFAENKTAVFWALVVAIHKTIIPQTTTMAKSGSDTVSRLRFLL